MIVAGFGFRSAASVESLADALRVACDTTPDLLATLETKATEPAFEGLAAKAALPTRAVAPDLARAQTTATRSNASLDAHDLASVAEACALAAAGPGARLIVPRVISSDRLATCAIAKGGKP
ncbi:MAG: cobalamin biosynthesis protein [Pseudomonadota bacterium]